MGTRLMPKFKFDSTVTMGNLIATGAFLVAIIGFAYSASLRLDNLEDAVSEVSSVVVQIAVQKVTIDNMDRRVSVLEAIERKEIKP
jgi:hypothetical protein